MKELILDNTDAVAIVDDGSFLRLRYYHWNAEKRHGIWYAVRTERNSENIKVKIFLHHEIMPLQDGLVVDHINGNGLDNRRSNLRLCAQRQNVYNHGRRRTSRARFTGVQKRGARWIAKIQHEHQVLYLGIFDDEITAAKAYDTAALRLRGEFTRLNFPDADRIARGQPSLAATDGNEK